jgi:plastocyanin
MIKASSVVKVGATTLYTGFTFSTQFTRDVKSNNPFSSPEKLASASANAHLQPSPLLAQYRNTVIRISQPRKAAMPSLKSIIATVALATLVSAKTVTVTAKSDNTFDPSTVEAESGDIIEFHFEPANHSVVSGNYDFPCSPMQLGTGFFSGYINTESGEAV